METLKKVMNDKNITVSELADNLGMSVRALNNRLNGKTRLTFFDAVKIGNYVEPGSDLFWLFDVKRSE